MDNLSSVVAEFGRRVASIEKGQITALTKTAQNLNATRTARAMQMNAALERLRAARSKANEASLEMEAAINELEAIDNAAEKDVIEIQSEIIQMTKRKPKLTLATGEDGEQAVG